jgi:hypothetical protein
MCTLVLLTVSWFKYRKSKGGDGAKGIQTARFLLMFFTVVIFLSIMSLALKVISTISTLPTTVYTGLQVASSILDAFLVKYSSDLHHAESAHLIFIWLLLPYAGFHYFGVLLQSSIFQEAGREES